VDQGGKSCKQQVLKKMSDLKFLRTSFVD